MRPYTDIRYENLPHILDFIRKIPEIVEEKPTYMIVFDGLGTFDLDILELGFKKQVYRTIFPSSTTSFFYSFHSMLPPQKHGFLEWYMRFGEDNKIMTVPPWKLVFPKENKNIKLNKRTVFPFKSLTDVLAKKGMHVCHYSPYADTLFTKAVARKSERIKIRYLSEIFPLKECDFAFIYWDSFDSLRHSSNAIESWKVEKEMLSFYVRLFLERVPKGSRVVVMTDHGLVKVEKHYTLPKINNYVPVGGGRAAFYKNTTVEEVKKELGKRKIPARVAELEDVYKNRISRRCYKNYGNVVVIAEKNHALRYPFSKKKTFHACHHGGTSKEEMLINVYTTEI